MTIEEIFQLESSEKMINALKTKTINVPVWSGPYGLMNEYDPTKHPVMDKGKYPDIIKDNRVIPVSRLTLGLQRLAAKRMSELVCGIPVKRVYKPENDKQKQIAEWLEAIYDRNRIDSVNTERCNMLFAGCEVLTLWYGVMNDNNLYGFDSKLKLRCINYTPMRGDNLYPLFDEYGDMIAMSVEYTRKVENKTISYFDTYTETQHVKWSDESGTWEEVQNEAITLGKIPAIYMYRPTPIWEDTSKTVEELEWTYSRNGNYIRENSKPLLAVYADEVINYGDEKDANLEGRAVMQYPKGSTLQYVTWQQAVENIKFHTTELRSWFFTQLQLPDWSYDKMSQQALSGESRKQMFIDAQLKVKDESGRLLEFFDREMNVVKAFLKAAGVGEEYHADIDALKVKTIITPFAIRDDADTISNLMNATGGEPIMSQREAIELYGHSDNVDKTIEEINQQKAAAADVFTQNPMM